MGEGEATVMQLVSLLDESNSLFHPPCFVMRALCLENIAIKESCQMPWTGGNKM